MATQIPDKMPKIPAAETREVYEERVKAELDRLNARIDEFKAKADQAKAEAEINYRNAMEEITAKRDALALKWEEMNSSGEAAWKELQKGFESAWNELANSFEKASKKFDW
ncbi:hypothetical protein PN498_12845 [Oscillatoria sp. CS-180]|uniref:hypothetical protein n=1 Tax=Oscillatoria sp. CS-180 TaxID=3021720 RepID=UPI00232CF0F6|nr:hypothetical protein [Oscillatoria sp. CS-180]MDB9526879.1 hypothetical protein [Oscillatoria sp. CS-180]